MICFALSSLINVKHGRNRGRSRVEKHRDQDGEIVLVGRPSCLVAVGFEDAQKAEDIGSLIPSYATY